MTLNIALAQLNLLVGGISHNADKIIQASVTAKNELQADVIVFSELTITAYPPEDLLLRVDFIEAANQAILDIAKACPDIYIILGFPQVTETCLFNSAAVLFGGEIQHIYRKNVLANYGVFDENRYFAAGNRACVFDLNGVNVGLSICEDIWDEGVVEQSHQAGAEIIFNLNASPFHAAKVYERESVVRDRIEAIAIPVVYVNQVGGQDELIFDGASFVMDKYGEIIFRAVEFEEQLSVVKFNQLQQTIQPIDTGIAEYYAPVSSEYQALVLGVRDYVHKNGFQGAILGLSGGIDSALTLAIAVDALGKDQVEAVLMPSCYTQAMSLEDAILEAEALGVEHHTIPIKAGVDAFEMMLAPLFAGTAKDTTEENIQARCRGVLLMALSNKQGKLLLTTGNKSEMSVGYATLYGDMAGGFAPLKDVPKLLVFELSKYRNTLSLVIPERVITRPPSAELAPDQIDEDSLPPYSVLDPILERYIEQDQAVEEIINAGFKREDVLQATRLVDLNEYKRRQSPPGIRITSKAFGRDRRYPITSGFVSRDVKI